MEETTRDERGEEENERERERENARASERVVLESAGGRPITCVTAVVR